MVISCSHVRSISLSLNQQGVHEISTIVLLIERIVSPTLQVDVFVLNEILIRVIDGRVVLQYQVGGCKTIHYVITVTAIRHVTQH